MTTSEFINTACADLGIRKAALAKRMGMHECVEYLQRLKKWCNQNRKVQDG